MQRILRILIFITICALVKAEEIENCDYFDTVDLTGHEKVANGNYEYEGVLIPPEETGTYNYKILFEGTRTTVKDHLRGCVCKIKPCIRYCCHRHRLDLSDEEKCTKELNDVKVNIIMENGRQEEIEIREQFVVQPGIRIQCDKNIHLVEFTKNDDWKLFENGTLYRSNDDVYLSKRDYCIQPKELDSQGLNYKLLPMDCLNKNDTIYVNLLSILILLLTTCIYIFALKLQHIHDKCYLCYLICLSVSLLINILTKVESFLFGASCYFVAYLGYFFSISIYLWLAVIAYDLWRILYKINLEDNTNNNGRFWIYSLFVWGSAFVLLLITILADNFLDNLDIDSNWKMGYAYYECYGKLTDWSSFVYFFAPAAIMVSINIAFVIMTVWRVHTENEKNRQQLSEFGQHKIKNHMRFTIYLRFFIIAFMDFLIEFTAVVYNLAGNIPRFVYHIMFYLALCHCILIFTVTVFRKDVLQLLSGWVSGVESKSVATTNTSQSTAVKFQNDSTV